MAIPKWVRAELRENYARASRAGRRVARVEPRAVAATYVPRVEALRIDLTNGTSITIPVGLISGLEHATPREIGSVEVLGRGGGLHWASLDLDVNVGTLVGSLFAGPSWMAELGRAGGRRSSTAKAAAARANGRKGGRPRMSP